MPRKHTGIATHYLRYSISNGMVMLFGFISFPILTRFLDNTQFGILRYYDTLMLVGVAIIKLGSQHAIMRFYPYDGDARRVREFGTNIVLLPLLLCGMVWLLLAACLAMWSWLEEGAFSPLVWCAIVMMPMLAATGIIQMVIRASERSDVLMATRVIGRLLELMLVLGAVVLVQRSALAVYGGKIVAWLAHWMFRNVHIARDAIDLQAVRSGLIYGLPLMAHELAFSILANVDRVLLKQLTGDFAMVGIYAIG
ncbi:MAG TPA: oligosaccharide flippase family protein, partial [Pseudoxanthomonas sp.]